MKVIHVVPHVTAEASGPSYSVPSLCRALGRAGCDVTLMTQTGEPLPPSDGFRHLTFPERGWPKRLHPSPALAEALHEAAADADLLHNHSIWLWPNVYPGRAAKATGTPLLLSPRGTLSEAALSRSAVVKKIFWHLVQGPAFHRAVCYHATADKELKEIRNLGISKPVAVLPNGIDLPEISRSDTDTERTLLYLGRLHPIKGLELLLEVWSALPANLRKGWRLRLVGPNEDGHEAVLRSFIRTANLTDVTIAGPAYGGDKDAEYARADLYILPSKTENFGMTAAEALSLGTPVIASQGAPWSGLVDEGCGWWVERTAEGLTAALSQALALDRVALSDMGAKGRAWMRRDYHWDGIATQMAQTYEWVLGGQTADPPNCVSTGP